MAKWLLAAALTLIAFPSSAAAQSKKSLVGTWKLVSVKNTNDRGEVEDMYGPNPIGLLTYTADGRVSVLIADSRRKPLFSSGTPTADAKAEAFSSFNAYAGSYTFTGESVTNHIEVSSYQDSVNTDQVRSVTIQGNRLTLRGEALVGGVMYHLEVVWERMKPGTANR